MMATAFFAVLFNFVECVVDPVDGEHVDCAADDVSLPQRGAGMGWHGKGGPVPGAGTGPPSVILPDLVSRCK